MKPPHYLSRLLLSIIAAALFACSATPEEKPLPESLDSPARLLDQGISEYNADNYAAAIRQFEKALLQYRSIDNQTGIANSCLNLANTYMAINQNQLAAEYLLRANTVIQGASLTELNEHLSLLSSSLAIKNGMYGQALLGLEQATESQDTTIQLAALKNRTSIAFLRNDNDKIQWLEKYKTTQKQEPANPSHAARILRFEAEASDSKDKSVALLAKSLHISQQLANRTAIAATLTQWATLDKEENRYNDAEDKYLRALFIRHQLGDVRSSLSILEQLHAIYAAINDDKAAITKNWINRLTANDLTEWDALYADFDMYPQPD